MVDVLALQIAMLMEEGVGINNFGILPIDFMVSVHSMFCQGRVHGVDYGQSPSVFLSLLLFFVPPVMNFPAFLLHPFHCCIYNLVMVALPVFSLMRATV